MTIDAPPTLPLRLTGLSGSYNIQMTACSPLPLGEGPGVRVVHPYEIRDTRPFHGRAAIGYAGWWRRGRRVESGNNA